MAAKTATGGLGRRPTLAAVAAEAGVSVMTASYSYNQPSRVSDATRQRVLAAAERLGYGGPDPSARSLRRGRTLNLGVVLGEQLSYVFDDPAAVSFLAGLAEVCATHGYGVTILPVGPTASDLDRLVDAAVDGFVLWTTSDDDPMVGAVRATKRPVVIHGGPSVEGVGLVSIDNRAAARAVGGCAFAAARRPAVLSQPLDRERVRGVLVGADPDAALYAVTRDRLAGFRDAAQDAGLAWSRVRVAVASRNDAAEAEELAAELLDASDPPDAIATMSDQQAAGVLRAALARGLAVPQDLAVTGFDDQPVAAELGLTTVRQSLREQGATCARIILADESAPTTPTATWSLARRTTTRDATRSP